MIRFIRKRKCLFIISILIIALLIMKFKSYNKYKGVSANRVKEGRLTIAIDPGHGGKDPGKVGVNGALEKDINLIISLKLKKLLEEYDINVIMTRETDEGLYKDTDQNKKRADLNNRLKIINESNVDFVISIHQNSFEQEAIKGAQVFYHESSAEGRSLASNIQEELKAVLNDNNHRNIKKNNTYYMLKKSECPLVIVECGYLSNFKEASLLIEKDYQEKIAYAICLGILKYKNLDK